MRRASRECDWNDRRHRRSKWVVAEVEEAALGLELRIAVAGACIAGACIAGACIAAPHIAVPALVLVMALGALPGREEEAAKGL